MDTSPEPTALTDRLPDWLAEALDVLAARRRVVAAAAVGLLLLGAVVALVAPTILPPRAVVGAAVGVASALLATAVALAMDASDLVVRGSRHVRAAGGAVDARVARDPEDVGPLLAAVARHATEGRVRVALSPASRRAGVPGPRAAALAEALARTGRRVLLTDLTRGGTPAAGLSDVVTGARGLPDVVRFEQDLYLARLAVGSEPDVALRGFPSWVQGLPRDLEVLVVALPPLAERGVLAAAGAMDLTLVLVEVDRTERVDLIASLDAVDASHLTSELVLVDPQRTRPVATGAATAATADAATATAPADGADEASPPAPTPAMGVAAAPTVPEDERSAGPDDVATEDPPVRADADDGTAVAPAENDQLDPVTARDDQPDVAPEEDAEQHLLAALGLEGSDDGPRWGGTGEIPVTRVPDGRGDAEEAPAPDEPTAAPAGEAPASHAPAEDAPVGAAPRGDEPEAGGPPVAAEEPELDATAEIVLPTSDRAADRDDLAHIWDAPAAAAPAAPVPPVVPATDDAGDDPGGAPTDAPDEAVVDDAEDAPAPTPAPAEEAPPATETPATQPGTAEPPAREPAATEPPAREPAAEAPAPDDDRPREPALVGGAARARDAEVASSGLDPASMEAARTSAALHQLAQQIWDRDGA
jgi:hypothetical protein